MLEMKSHPIHKDYQVFENGDVIGKKGFILKPYTARNGYLKVKVNKVSRLVHRLVAETYLPNPNNLPQVNHIDGDKSNNNVDNLEWCDLPYNVQHYFHKKGFVYQIFKDGKLFLETISLFDFSKKYNVAKSPLYKCVNKNKTFKGFSVKRIERKS